MAVTPEVIFPGTLFSILGQFGLTSIMAVNLRAVTHVALPWAQMSWTFPAILVVSAMPFTVAGTGMREMAALALLGLFGVPPEQCIAASLLTLAHKLTWATVGGIIFWRNGRYYSRFKNVVEPKTISLLLPYDRKAHSILETIRHARANPEIAEILIVQGEGKLAELIPGLDCAIYSSAVQAASHAKGDVLLILPPGNLLPPYAGLAALNCLRDSYVVAGGFWKTIQASTSLGWRARLGCAWRLVFARRVALSQGLFLRRSILEQIGGLPELNSTGEVELCRRLRKKGRLALADAIVIAPAP